MSNVVTASNEVFEHMFFTFRNLAANSHDVLRKKRKLFEVLNPVFKKYQEEMAELEKEKLPLTTNLAKAQNKHNEGVDLQIEVIKKMKKPEEKTEEEFRTDIENAVVGLINTKLPDEKEIQSKLDVVNEKIKVLKEIKKEITFDREAITYYKASLEGVLNIVNPKSGLSGIGGENQTEMHCMLLDALGL